MYTKLILFSIILNANCQHLEIKNLNHDPLLLLHVRNCYIQTGIVKVIHPINLTVLEENVNLFLDISRKIDRTLPMSNLIARKSRQLLDNLYQLKPLQKTRRQKRWDSVGTAWKWIAGSPDAEDLRIINNTFNELINETNKQIQINHVINERITKISDTVNTLIDHHTTLNTILLKDIDAIILLLSMDATNNILEDIEDAILRARVSLPNSKLLTIKEIFLIESILNKQGIATRFPEDALNYATPKIASTNEMMLYILELPQTNGDCKIFEILPLITNNTVLTNTPNYVIKSNKKLFTTNHPENAVQQLHEAKPFIDSCVYPIIMGMVSHCNATTTNQTNLQLLSGNRVLVNNAVNLNLTTNC
ncbi:uncharacterized protein LOC134207107 [Armigeres subalbatus]|uniref:uncharacterized protein LOC134207107 n=1 Tax=Armigeres subalbatus TaxID=124917 RepID=UPI002ED47BB2